MDDFNQRTHKLLEHKYIDIAEFENDIKEFEEKYKDTEFCKSEIFFHIKEAYQYEKAKISLENSSDEMLISILKKDVQSNIWNDRTDAAYDILYERFPGKRVDDFLA